MAENYEKLILERTQNVIGIETSKTTRPPEQPCGQNNNAKTERECGRVVHDGSQNFEMEKKKKTFQCRNALSGILCRKLI